MESQATLLTFSQQLLAATAEAELLHAVATAAAEMLQVEFSSTLILVDENDPEGELIIRTAYGWPDSVLGQVVPGRGRSQSSHTILQQQPVLVEDYAVELAFNLYYMVEGLNVRCGLSTPMMHEGRAIGVIIVNSRLPDVFSADKIQLLSIIANLAAVALDKVRLLENTRRQTDQQTTLLRLSAELSKAQGEIEIWQVMVDGLHDALGYDGVGVLLFDEASGERELVVYAGAVDLPIGYRFGPREGISERAFLDGRLYYYPDVSNQPQHILSGAGGGAELDAPIWLNDKVIGVLVAESKQVDAFDEKDFDMLVAAVNQAGLAVARARLLAVERRRVDEMAALRATVADITTELELPKLLDAVLKRAVVLLDAAGGALGLYDEVRQDVVVAAARSMRKGTRLKLGEGVMGQVTATGEPLIINNYQQWPGRLLNPEMERWKCVLAAPLMVRGRLLGAIAITDRHPTRQFDEADLNLLNLFAQQVAIAIENARVFRDEQRRREMAAVLLDITQTASASLEPQEVLKQISQRTAAACQADRCTILLLNETREKLLPVMSQFADKHAELAQWRLFQAMAPEAIEAVPLFYQVVQERRLILVDDAQNSDLIPARWVQPFELRKLLAVPLVSHDHSIGVLLLDRADLTYEFTAEQIELAQTIGAQVAVNIENAHLYESIMQAAESRAILHRASQEISASLDPHQVYVATHRAVSQLLPFDVFFIALSDEARQDVEFVYFIDVDENFAPIKAPLQDSLSGQVISTAKAVRIDDIQHDSDVHVMHFGQTMSTRSILAVPMWLKGKVFGVISTQSYEIGVYTADHQHILSTLANQVAVAIENARLFQATQQYNRELATFHRVAASIDQQIDLQQLLDSALATMVDLLGFDSACLITAQPDGRLQVESSRNVSPRLLHLLSIFPVVEAKYWQWIISRDVIVVQDVRDAPLSTGQHEILLAENVRSMAFITLQAKGQLIGALYLGHSQINGLDRVTPILLRTLGSQLTALIENARLYMAEKQRTRELDALYSATAALLNTTLNLETLLNQTLDAAIEAIPAAERGILVLASAAQQAQVRVVRGYSTLNEEQASLTDATSTIVVPLILDERTIGTLAVETSSDKSFAGAERRLLRTFATTVTVAIRNARLYAEVEHLSRIDALTGVYNRRYFIELGQREFERARRYRRPLAVFMIDLDKFKRVNDTYGHDIGDQVLIHIARRCSQQFREVDVFCRYGGEEFAVIIPESGNKDVLSVADRLRQIIADEVIPVAGSAVVRLTMSVGVAVLGDDRTLEDLLTRADQAMYRAKEIGGNLIMEG